MRTTTAGSAVTSLTPGPRRRFAKIDANGNGYLEPSEIELHRRPPRSESRRQARRQRRPPVKPPAEDTPAGSTRLDKTPVRLPPALPDDAADVCARPDESQPAEGRRMNRGRGETWSPYGRTAWMGRQCSSARLPCSSRANPNARECTVRRSAQKASGEPNRRAASGVARVQRLSRNAPRRWGIDVLSRLKPR